MLLGGWCFPFHLECYPIEPGSKYWLCSCFCVFSTEKEGGVCTVRGLRVEQEGGHVCSSRSFAVHGAVKG